PPQLSTRMLAMTAPDVCGFIAVAVETTPVSLCACEFRAIPDVGRRSAICVFTTRSMAGFAGSSIPTAFLIRLDCEVWILAEGLVNVLMAHLAGFGTHVSSAWRGGRFRGRCLGSQPRKENERDDRRDCQR